MMFWGNFAGAPCPIRICITQRVDCISSDGTAKTCFAPFTICSTILFISGGPDDFSKICYYDFKESFPGGDGPCKVAAEKVTIERLQPDGITPNETITLSGSDAQTFVDIISLKEEPHARMLCGTFVMPCGEDNEPFYVIVYCGDNYCSIEISHH
jgi:hypothetical protein